MGVYSTNTSELTLVADAIRNLGGTSASISYPFGWVNALSSIKTWPYGECGDLQGSVASRKTLNATFQANASITFVSFPSVSSVTSSRAFRGCSNLRGAEFRILSSIPRLMFATCSQLQSVSFPECTTIDYGAFFYCIDMKKADFPNCTTIIGTSSTIGFSVSSTSYFPVSYPSTSYAGAFNRAGIREANFPLCTSIGSMAFRDCSALTTVNFPACTTVGNYAFFGCTALTSVSFPNCENFGDWAMDGTGIIEANFPVCSYIGGSAFKSCSALTTANFPACTSIWYSAFASCPALTTVSFPVCTFVGSYAFESCSALTSVNFSACEIVYMFAFENCTALTTINLPACTSINSYAFKGCSALTTASIPACSRLDSCVFENCSSLTSLYLLYNSKTVYIPGSNVFASTPMVNSTYTGTFGSIYVPASLLTAYMSSTNWAYFSDRFVGLTDEEIAAL